jgi:hypothetical protein
MVGFINTDLSMRGWKVTGTDSCKFPVLISNTLNTINRMKNVQSWMEPNVLCSVGGK